MTWIKKNEPPVESCKHPDLPAINRYDTYLIGSIWQCDVCEKQMYVVQGTLFHKNSNPSYPSYEPVAVWSDKPQQLKR